jgi:hypothetical protein
MQPRHWFGQPLGTPQISRTIARRSGTERQDNPYGPEAFRANIQNLARAAIGVKNQLMPSGDRRMTRQILNGRIDARLLSQTCASSRAELFDDVIGKRR